MGLVSQSGRVGPPQECGPTGGSRPIVIGGTVVAVGVYTGGGKRGGREDRPGIIGIAGRVRINTRRVKACRPLSTPGPPPAASRPGTAGVGAGEPNEGWVVVCEKWELVLATGKALLKSNDMVLLFHCYKCCVSLRPLIHKREIIISFNKEIGLYFCVFLGD